MFLWTNALLDKCLSKHKSRNMRVLLFSGEEGRELWVERGKIFQSGVLVFIVSCAAFSLAVPTSF